jgi:hypothetical protein
MKNEMEKHLEFIQNIINRHNSNSFMLKGWAVTISSALFAIAGTVKEPLIVLIALAPIGIFWGLDSFYLSNERCFIDLYNAVSKGAYSIPTIKIFKKDFNPEVKDIESGKIGNYEMNFKKFEIWKDNSWFEVFKSKTILWFYFPLMIITFCVMLMFASTKTNSTPMEVNANLKSDSLTINLRNPIPTTINNVFPKTELVDTCKKSSEKK